MVAKKMNRLQMKKLKSCFDTKFFNHNNPICKGCQFSKKCWKARRLRYSNVKAVERGNDVALQ